MANEVFTSYSRKDFDKVVGIKKEIDRVVGIECWMDLDGINSDAQFVDVIVSAINRHDTILFMMSEASMHSKWALSELALAQKKQKRIVLVKIDDAEMPDNFFLLYNYQQQTDWNSRIHHDKLLSNLKAWHGRKIKEPVKPEPVIQKAKRKELNVQVLEGHTDFVNSASFSPDGKRIVSASQDKTVRIWDAQTGKLLQTLEGHTGWVYSASFSPDGKRIDSASMDNTIRIWDAQTGELMQALKGHTDSILSASFSPDGRLIVSASLDKTIRIWNVQTGRLLQTIEGHTDSVTDSVSSASFSPDGKRIVSALRDETVRIWDAQTGKLLQTLEGHTGWVRSASFSPDGKRIVSASDDKTIRIWNLPDE